MRHFANFEIYECRECRLFVNEKVKESDVNNVNTSSLEHSSLLITPPSLCLSACLTLRAFFLNTSGSFRARCMI